MTEFSTRGGWTDRQELLDLSDLVWILEGASPKAIASQAIFLVLEHIHTIDEDMNIFVAP